MASKISSEVKQLDSAHRILLNILVFANSIDMKQLRGVNIVISWLSLLLCFTVILSLTFRLFQRFQ